MNTLARTLLLSCCLAAIAGCASERSRPTASTTSPASTTTDSLTGTWVGTMSKTGANTVSIRYEITDTDGVLTGDAFDLEPGRNQYVKTGTLTGTRTGTSGQWTSDGDSVSGTLSGDTFTGTLVVAASGPDSSLTSQVSLQRSSCVRESDATFCTRLLANCSQLTGADNCGVRRAVASCGTCTGGPGACVQNRCQSTTCQGTTQGTCDAESGCGWNSGCCGGLCLPDNQTCPVTCPPPAG